MKWSQDSQQGGELHEPPTELDCGECEHYLKVIHNTQHITPYLINWHKWQVHIISFSKILPFIMLSALCTPYHVQGWLPYTDSICKIFYVQIMSYHQPILNIIYHKTMYFHMFDHHLIPGCQGDQYLQHPLRRRRLSRLCGLWPLPCLAYKQELTGNYQEKGNF